MTERPLGSVYVSTLRSGIVGPRAAADDRPALEKPRARAAARAGRGKRARKIAARRGRRRKRPRNRGESRENDRARAVLRRAASSVLLFESSELSVDLGNVSDRDPT